MTQRLDYIQQVPELFKKFVEFTALVENGGLDTTINHLLMIRVSQINGCLFCLDMHVKQAKIHGERDLRVHHVAVWRESPLFSERERAALAWTEALTHLPEGGVPDEIYENVRKHFSDKELSVLTFAIMKINAWNRLGVAFLSKPGSADKAFGLDKAGLE